MSARGTPVVSAANRVNAMAASAGAPPVFDFPQIIKGINFDELAADYPQCWACTLGKREPPRRRRGAEEEPAEEPKAEESEREPLKGKKRGPRFMTPLRGARRAQRRLHEMWLLDYSSRRMEEEMRALAIELGWSADEVPGFDRLAAHFRLHLPVQMAARRDAVERAAAAEGVAGHIAANLGTMRSVIDKIMMGVTDYLNVSYEVTSPQEMAAMVRLADELASKVAARGTADRQMVDVTQILMEVRRIMPSHYFDQVVGRFWDVRAGRPVPGPVAEARALPAGPPLSDEVPPPPETENLRAARELAARSRERREAR